MGRAEKHPTDEGKYQSTFDDYGHGKGNGKSRASVYKHYKKNAYIICYSVSFNQWNHLIDITFNYLDRLYHLYNNIKTL